MSKVYCKWVSNDLTSENGDCWEIGVPRKLPRRRNLTLHSSDLFIYYKDPLFAVMFKESHGGSQYTKLYKVKPGGKIVKDWNSCGATELTLIQELEIPEVTLIQKIAFGILCAKAVYQEENFINWAEKWLNGEDRSKESALAIYGADRATHTNGRAANGAIHAAYVYAGMVDVHYAIDDVHSVVCIYAYIKELLEEPMGLIPLMKKAMEVK